jgi:hypothetical protein
VSKKKKKKEKTSEGVILVQTVAVSDEEKERILSHLETLDCEFKVFIQEKCEIVKFDETYYGPCPWCKVAIYTKDVCPECGKLVDLI